MALLRIGDLARLGGVSVRMLRRYHEVGVLVPDQIDHHLAELDRRSTTMTDPTPTQPLDVEVKSVAARLVAQLTAVAESWAPEHIGPVIQPLYPELIARLERAGVDIAGPSTAWYEDTAEGRVLVHATLTIAEHPSADPASLGFDVVELPALAEVASTIHRGTMDDCDTTYAALLAWIADHGYRARGYSREIDIECGPGGAWITELQLAIERS